jgi:hypothetical protein
LSRIVTAFLMSHNVIQIGFWHKSPAQTTS